VRLIHRIKFLTADYADVSDIPEDEFDSAPIRLYQRNQRSSLKIVVTNPLRRERSTTSPNERLTMNFTKNIGMLLLAIYLILAGLGMLLGIVIPVILMGILAIAAGVFILIGR
jgi:hypothetical protein